ncbi:MAG: SET domain-containing protein-lysine N-methyltransferase [Chlorobiales bacterium]|nr:SET domain-containing protein-lysine N-methyltransferase [Chlorobiales bacterium]
MIKSILSEKIIICDSPTHNKGLFAIDKIQKGEIVFIKGGHILRKKQIFSTTIINSYHPIDDEYYIGATNAHEEEKIKLYVNHSCNPNCGIRGDITYIAMRDIIVGEELTVDYAFLDNEDYSFECACGESNCRKTITGRDWKIKEIQEKYYEYFAAYLKVKIKSKKV